MVNCVFPPIQKNNQAALNGDSRNFMEGDMVCVRGVNGIPYQEGTYVQTYNNDGIGPQGALKHKVLIGDAEKIVHWTQLGKMGANNQVNAVNGNNAILPFEEENIEMEGGKRKSKSKKSRKSKKSKKSKKTRKTSKKHKKTRKSSKKTRKTN